MPKNLNSLLATIAAILLLGKLITSNIPIFHFAAIKILSLIVCLFLAFCVAIYIGRSTRSVMLAGLGGGMTMLTLVVIVGAFI